MASDETNLDAVTADILDELEDEDDKALVENMRLMVAAGVEDMREEIQASETFALNEGMAHHAKTLIISYAAICVKMGQSTGQLDGNGQATEKMPKEIAGYLDEVTKSFGAFKEMYVKVHGQAAWEEVANVA